MRWVLPLLLLASACNQILGFDDLDTSPPAPVPQPKVECAVDADCSGGAPAGGCEGHTCEDGSCKTTRKDEGADCTHPQPGHCTGEGECVVCRQDRELNDAETDVDCGGGDCPPCGDGDRCEIDGDCENGVCQFSPVLEALVCHPATCVDKLENGRETDVNCGGPCLPCVQGRKCLVPADCETGFCSGGICCGVPCDGLCERCIEGTGACDFVVDDDIDDSCEGTFNLCCPTATLTCPKGSCSDCFDQMTNGHETDRDCGGGVCAKCPVNKKCEPGQGKRDCESCICGEIAGEPHCVAPQCTNGIQDECESDIDCGGPCNATCGDGQKCGSKSDCASFSCAEGKCVGP